MQDVLNWHEHYFSAHDKYSENNFRLLPAFTNTRHLELKNDHDVCPSGYGRKTRQSVPFGVENVDYITFLYLKIYNPQNKSLDKLIEQIEVEVGGSIVQCLDNLDFTYANLQELKLVKETRRENDYTIVNVPYFNLLWAKYSNQNVYINVTWKSNMEVCDHSLYGDITVPHTNWFRWTIQRIGWKETSDKMSLGDEFEGTYFQSVGSKLYETNIFEQLPFNHPAYCLFVQINTDLVTNVKLMFDDYVYYDGPIKQELLSTDGFVFNFSRNFTSYSDQTIDFSMIKKAKLLVETSVNTMYNIQYIHSQVIKYQTGMYGMRYSK